MSEFRILGADGAPMRRPPPPRTRGLPDGGVGAWTGGSMAGGMGAYSTPFEAADIYGQHMSHWRPTLWSPDAELNPARDRMVARFRDVVRNDGWASGAVTRILDNAIGATFRPISKPDHRALRAYSGLKGFDAVWADEFGRAVDANWRVWTHDPGRYCDAARGMNFSQIARAAFRHKLVDGDALAVMMWIPGRVGAGRARYATAVQLIDPDRLSNPQLQFDSQTMRGGVEIDEYGAAYAYTIRKAHQGDWWSAAESLTWERVLREDPFGRPRVVHDFDHDRAAQHRGVGAFAPIVQRMKMLVKYDGTELDAAIVNAIFGAYVESPFDPQLVAEAMGADSQWAENDAFNGYQSMRAEFHRERNLMLGGVRIPHFFPGEKITAINAARPVSNFAEFENAVLRNVAAGLGLSAQQVSNNWSDVNYSSARGALLESWKTLTRRRDDFAWGFCAPIRVAWLEESLDVDDYPLPSGAPEFMECRGAYSACKFVGPGRGWIDPVAEKQGAILGMASGLSTLETEIAENVGEDWEDYLDQRKLEIQRVSDLGLPPLDWSGVGNAMQGKSTDEKPSKAPEKPL